jgi:hypothetical protein
MSIESIAVCLHHSKSSGTDKLVLLGIANHDGDGGAWPSIETLAKYANTTERNVTRCINNLISLGEVTRHTNQGGMAHYRNDKRPNRYDVLVRCPNECDGTTQHRLRGDIQGNGMTHTENGVTSRVERGDVGVTLTIHEPSIEPSSNTHASFDAEVHTACNLLADLIAGNGSKRPAVTEKWLADMERLHRIDERSWEQITKAIHWCQDDDFWKANIMSPAKLRKQYDQLRLAAQRDQKKQSPASGWLGILNRVREQDALEIEQ